MYFYFVVALRAFRASIFHCCAAYLAGPLVYHNCTACTYLSNEYLRAMQIPLSMKKLNDTLKYKLAKTFNLLELEGCSVPKNLYLGQEVDLKTKVLSSRRLEFLIKYLYF